MTLPCATVRVRVRVRVRARVRVRVRHLGVDRARPHEVRHVCVRVNHHLEFGVGDPDPTGRLHV